MSIDRTKINFYSGDPTDNVLKVFTGSMTIPVRTADVNIETIDTGLTNNPFWVGVFTVDSDDTVNDIGSSFIVDDFAGTPTGYGISASAKNGNIKLASTTNDTDSHTCDYKIAVIAQPKQGIIDIPTTNTPNLLKYIEAGNNYRKIYSDKVIPFTISSSATDSKAIPHPLGYEPSVMAFIEVSGEMFDATAIGAIASGLNFTFCAVEVSVDSSAITYSFENSTGNPISSTIYLRIYYDKN